jgi:hypothetical protein
MGLWMQYLRTRFRLKITKKGYNPALQSDRTTASQTLGI